MWQHPLVMWPHPVVTWPHSCIGWAHDDVISILYNVTVCVCWWCNYEVIWGHSEIIWCNGVVTWCEWPHDDVMWSNPSADLCVREDIGMIRFLQRSAMQTKTYCLWYSLAALAASCRFALEALEESNVISLKKKMTSSKYTFFQWLDFILQLLIFFLQGTYIFILLNTATS